jgi:hypothetical protein
MSRSPTTNQMVREFARVLDRPAAPVTSIDTQLDALTIMARLMREAFPSASDRKLEAA